MLFKYSDFQKSAVTKFLGYVSHLSVPENPHKQIFCIQKQLICIGICKFNWAQYGGRSIELKRLLNFTKIS